MSLFDGTPLTDAEGGRSDMGVSRVGTHHLYVPCSRCQRTGYVPKRLLDRWNEEVASKNCKVCLDLGYVLVGSHAASECLACISLTPEETSKP